MKIERVALILPLTLLGCGLALGQAAPPPPGPGAPPPPGGPHGHHEMHEMHDPGDAGPEHGGFLEPDKLATLLDLSPAQAAKVKGVLDQERDRMHQMHEQHMRQMEKMMEEMRSTHEKVRQETLHQLGGVLSAPQLKKFEILMDSMRERGGPPHGMGPHGMHPHEMGPHGMDDGAMQSPRPSAMPPPGAP